VATSPQRLAVFLPGLYGGGAERTMLNLAGGLAALGYPVDLVLAMSEGPYMSLIPDTVRLIELKASRTATSVPALMRYLRREGPAGMVSALSRANLVAVWARWLTGLPNRLLVNEQNTLSVLTRNAHDWRVRVVPSLARIFYPWATAVVAVSQGVADDLVESLSLPRDLVKVIHNPGVAPEMREKAKQPLAHPWFEAGLAPVVLAVGSLTPQKDFENLLRAIALVRAKRPVRLLILGEGEERPRLEGLVRELHLEDDVAFPGFVDNPYAYMARAALFVLSSRWEGLPTVLVEAMYCGAPLVATDCPSGPREILRNGELGCLVPVGQPAGLAEAILKTLDGRTPRPGASSCDPYTVERVAEQYLALLLPRAAPTADVGTTSHAA